MSSSSTLATSSTTSSSSSSSSSSSPVQRPVAFAAGLSQAIGTLPGVTAFDMFAQALVDNDEEKKGTPAELSPRTRFLAITDPQLGRSILNTYETRVNNLNQPDNFNQHSKQAAACCKNIYQAIFHNHRRCFDKLVRHQDHPAKVTAFAAYHGRLGMLKDLVQSGPYPYGSPWDFRVYRWAAMRGQIACLKFALDHECPEIELSDAMMYGCGAGQLVAVRWMHEHGFPWSDTAVVLAAEIGDMRALRYLLDHPTSCPRDECRERRHTADPASKGCCMRPILQLSSDSGQSQATQFVCVCSPQRPAMLGYSALHATPEAFCVAAGNGYLEVVKYMWSRHGSWSTRVISHALNNLTRRPAPISDEAWQRGEGVDDAVTEHIQKVQEHERRLEILRFCIDNHCPKPVYVCSMLFDGCQGFRYNNQYDHGEGDIQFGRKQCSNCVKLKSLKTELFGELKAHLPKDINILVCEFACEMYSKSRKRCRLAHDDTVSRTNYMIKDVTSDDDGDDVDNDVPGVKKI